MESDDVVVKPNIARARTLARKLLKDAGVSVVPVSLVKVIDHLEPLHNLQVMRLPLGDNLAGLLVTIDERPTIGFNSEQAWVRRRFTIAHEIGHLLMDHLCGGTRTYAEQEANSFAAELLIPLALIRADFAATPDVETLAKKYVVSREALCRHLMECRVL